MNMSAPIAWKNAKALKTSIPKVDEVYVLRDGNLEREKWYGPFSEKDYGVILLGTKDNIPVIRDETPYDALKMLKDKAIYGLLKKNANI